jgi:hypothetical protein
VEDSALPNPLYLIARTMPSQETLWQAFASIANGSPVVVQYT